jgi:pimeloyl-ACP methyl ester carboxylesterase
MAMSTNKVPPHSETSFLLEVSALGRRNVGETERGAVEVQEEAVGYELYTLDARSDQQREQDTHRGRLDGNIVVVVPGHGQTIHGPKKLVATAALLSRSRIAWCIDPIPAKGGDRTEAQAIARVVRESISTAFPEMEEPIAATLIGWSHGGSQALLAAEFAPDLFPQVLGVCPTGLVDRQVLELLYSFFLEATRILWTSVRQRDWACLKDTLRVGWNACVGLVQDLWRSRSLRRLFEDIGWAARNVASSPIGYTGEVVLLFGAQDTVVRWGDLFPECDRPQDIPNFLAAYQEKNLPLASRVEVQVLEGSHVAPETDAPSFLQTGLGLLGQLDEQS